MVVVKRECVDGGLVTKSLDDSSERALRLAQRQPLEIHPLY